MARRGANQMALAVAGMAAENESSEAVQKLADSLIKELAVYKGPEKEKTPGKGHRKKSPER